MKIDKYLSISFYMRQGNNNGNFLVNLILLFCIVSAIAIALSIASLTKSSQNNSNIIVNNNSTFDWREASFSPIYSPYSDIISDEDYYPYVVYDSLSFSGHGSSYKYKMWHQGTIGSISISYSNDGITWILNGSTNLSPGYHACVLYSNNKFNGTIDHFYRIWYWTGNAGLIVDVIKTAESDDGITWVNIQSVTQNPFFPLVDGITPGLLFHLYGPGFIYYNTQSTNITGAPYTYPYVLFYDIASEGFGPGTSSEGIGLAYSLDGFNWTRYNPLPIPILIPDGCPGGFCWDLTHAYRPSLIIDSNNKTYPYHLYYSASNDDILSGLIYAHGIGHAISTDGVTWSIDYRNPIFYYNNPVPWRSGRTYTPFVLNFNGTLVMWFSGGSSDIYGQNGSIGYATCTNCL